MAKLALLLLFRVVAVRFRLFVAPALSMVCSPISDLTQIDYIQLCVEAKTI